MKRLLLIPLVIFLISCENNNYGSRAEAKTACEKWSKKGFIIKWEWEYSGLGEAPSKWCVYEKETRQYLGYSYYRVKKGKIYSSANDIPDNRGVEKRFRY
tara:strand:+ start:56 stop:355 length:300 start_codon:yes stop_codon:yes gene_type:complete